jgi:hypothetical protein
MRALIHVHALGPKHVECDVDEWNLESNRPDKHVKKSVECIHFLEGLNSTSFKTLPINTANCNCAHFKQHAEHYIYRYMHITPQ